MLKMPLPTSKGEGNVRNSRSTPVSFTFSTVPRMSSHGQLTALGIIEKHRIRVGDRISIRVAHGELHRDSAATLPLVNAAAVRVDRRQDNASRIRPSASAIADRKLPIHVTDDVVTQPGTNRCARRYRIRRRLRQSGRRITRASQRDVGYSVAVDQATYVKSTDGGVVSGV